MTPLAEQTIKRAREALGVSEGAGHNNRGKWVDVYEKFLGLIGQPWCACFVAFKIHQAAKDLGLTSRWPTDPRAANCTWLWNWAKKNGCVLSEPTYGTVVLFLRPNRLTAHHVGFCTSIAPTTNRVQILAGNTNDDGSSEGYEVAEKWETLSNLMVFVSIV